MGLAQMIAMLEKSNCLTAANYEFMHYTKD